MEHLGFTNYICGSTIYGDWSYFTYKGSEPNEEVIDNWRDLYLEFFCDYNSQEYIDNPEKRKELYNTFVKDKQDFLDKYCYGEFCADAGMVGVFDLDEVRKYNSDIDEWIASHKWCVTVIPDFEGEVEYQIDDNGDAHIIGTGNIGFIQLNQDFNL